jgi:hypothetical protein
MIVVIGTRVQLHLIDLASEFAAVRSVIRRYWRSGVISNSRGFVCGTILFLV